LFLLCSLPIGRQVAVPLFPLQERLKHSKPPKKYTKNYLRKKSFWNNNPTLKPNYINHKNPIFKIIQKWDFLIVNKKIQL